MGAPRVRPGRRLSGPALPRNRGTRWQGCRQRARKPPERLHRAVWPRRERQRASYDFATAQLMYLSHGKQEVARAPSFRNWHQDPSTNRTWGGHTTYIAMGDSIPEPADMQR